MAALAASTAAATPNVAAIDIDLGPYVEAGATPAQQLAILLSTGAAYLRAAEASGPRAGRGGVADPGHARVGRRRRSPAWPRVAPPAGCGTRCSGPVGSDPEARCLRLHVRTAARMMTRRDPWVNLLRVTAATFAAGVGGADGVTALPFDVQLGFPNELGRRMARNTQLLLIEESHVGRVVDPGRWVLVRRVVHRRAGRAGLVAVRRARVGGWPGLRADRRVVGDAARRVVVGPAGGLSRGGRNRSPA